jgi:hypothetical protein
VIHRHTEESIKDIGRTKTQVLRAIKRHDIANQRCSTITSADIIAFAKDAFVVVKRLGITTKCRARDRPTMDELNKLMTHFGERLERRPSSVPMQKITAFAIFSPRKSLASIGLTLMREEVGR